MMPLLGTHVDQIPIMNPSLLEFSQRCLAHIDYNYLVFFDFNKGVDPLLSTYPDEWCAHYQSNDYQKNDYVLQKKAFLPFYWDERLYKSLSLVQKQIFNEAKAFEIHKGITIPIVSGSTQGALTLSFRQSETLTQDKMQKMALDLYFLTHMILTYKSLTQSNTNSDESIKNLLHELNTWERNTMKKQKQKKSQIMEIMSDIRTTQLFISQHETKELGLETLQRAYQDLERIIS